MNYNLTDHWHRAKIAAEWPRGSVVLLRRKWDKSMAHSYVYLLSQFFTRHLTEQFPEAEFMLLEELKESNEHKVVVVAAPPTNPKRA